MVLRFLFMSWARMEDILLNTVILLIMIMQSSIRDIWASYSKNFLQRF